MGAMLGAIAEIGEAERNINGHTRSDAHGAYSVDAAAPRTAIAESTGAGGLEGLVSQLRGVPKGALKTVLGKDLGARIWRQARGKTAAADRAVWDGEVVAGLIGHLSRQAAEELRKNERQAKFVRLSVWYQDGSAASERARLAGLTQDAAEILAAAVRLFERFGQSAGQVTSVNLDVTVAGTNVASEVGRVPGWLAMPIRTAAG